MKTAGKLKKALAKKAKTANTAIKTKNLLSTGSTILNLACSGKINGGFPKGFYVYLVGDTSSGKTFLSMTCLGEASINPEFNEYRFVFDNAENGSLMNVRKFFGKAVEERLEPPKGTREDPQYSTTLEEFFANCSRNMKKGPCIYILDSMDALMTNEEEKKFEEDIKAADEGKEGKGSMGMSKAKKNSAGMRAVNNLVRKSGSILIVISQTRQNVGWNAQFNPRTRGGGEALSFYARLELWTSKTKNILKPNVNGKDRKIGRITKIKITKNHICGWESEIEVPIYRSVGFDDLGSCVDYLIEEKRWTENKKMIDATDFGVRKKKEDLIAWIEATDNEDRLRKIVGEVWDEIEAKCEIKRKPRYPR